MSSRTGRSGTSPPSLDELPFSPALRALAERAEPRRYRKGVLLIQEGDQGDTLYIVLAGRVRAFSQGDNEREITYGVYGPGEYVGEISLDGGPRSASVITVEPTACVVIPRQTLLLHIAQYPEFAFELLSKVIRRARSATLSAKQLALNDVYGRLRALLDPDPASIQASLSAAMARRGQWAAMGERNRDYVLNHLTWDQVAERTMTRSA